MWQNHHPPSPGSMHASVNWTLNAHQGLFKAALVLSGLSVGSGWDGQSETAWAARRCQRSGKDLSSTCEWDDEIHSAPADSLCPSICLSLSGSPKQTLIETQSCLLGSVWEKQFWCWTRDYNSSRREHFNGWLLKKSPSCYPRCVWLSSAEHKQMILEMYSSSVGPYNASGWWPNLKLQKAHEGYIKVMHMTPVV